MNRRRSIDTFASNFALIYVVVAVLSGVVGYESCPPIFDLFGSSCYHAVTTHHVTFDEADRACFQIYASLASIHSDEENDYIASQLSDDSPAWIGLRCNSSSEEWEWTDGSNLNYTNFEEADDILSSPCSSKMAVVVGANATWTRVPLHSFMDAFVCMAESLPESSTTIYPDCPDGFELGTSDWCFFEKHDYNDQMNFQQAQAFCENMGAILPAITSEEVTAVLMLDRSTKWGISPFEPFWIDLGCNLSTWKWEWVDGPPFDPSLAFFSNNLIDKETCDFVDTGSFRHVFNQFGTWTAEAWYEPNVLVVCATRPYSYEPPSPTVDPPCTGVWTSLPDGVCYMMTQYSIKMYQKDFTEAESHCVDKGGHLPKITSNEQNNVIQAYLIGEGVATSQFWIGLYCDGTRNRRWTDGTPFNNSTDDDYYSNFLNSDDDSSTCNPHTVSTFIYNAAVAGQWQRETANTTLPLVLCQRPDPYPKPSTTKITTASTPSTPKTTSTSVATTTYPDTTTYASTETPPTDGTEGTDPPGTDDTTTVSVPTTVSSTAVSESTTTTNDGAGSGRMGLSGLEILLISVLSIFIICAILVILLVAYCRKKRTSSTVKEFMGMMHKRMSHTLTNNVSFRTDDFEIPRQYVLIDHSRKLGRGAFGSVFLGRVFTENMRGISSRSLLQLNAIKKDNDLVAVKALHETADKQAAWEFLDEINIMKKIGFHERIVNILACVTATEPRLLICEYCSNGDLLKFMRDRRLYMLGLKDTVGHEIADRTTYITQRQQLMFAVQIAYGMEYLSQQGFVHRDLAARNILLDHNETCKIGDFGLCREIGRESDHYQSRGGRLPWKWMAPEALADYQFSVASDVWSFGVLLFEIVTLGGTPYPNWPAVELLDRLRAGDRMPKPECGSDETYSLMMSCWQGTPEERPSFSRIRRKLATALEESSGDEYYLKLNANANYYSAERDLDSRNSTPL